MIFILKNITEITAISNELIKKGTNTILITKDRMNNAIIPIPKSNNELEKDGFLLRDEKIFTNIKIIATKLKILGTDINIVEICPKNKMLIAFDAKPERKIRIAGI